MFCLSDFEAHAQKVLDRNAWDYYSSGANHEQTLRDNKEAFQRCVVSCVGQMHSLVHAFSSPSGRRYRLRPRLLRDVSSVDMRTRLLGEEVAFPICVAPTAMQRMAHPDGELATARGMTSQ